MPELAKGRYETASPNLTDQLEWPMLLEQRGALKVAIYSGVTSTGIAAAGDGVSAAQNGLAVLSIQELYNGATLDYQRGNINTAALISAAGATTSQTGADQTNYNGRGLIVVLDMTVVGTGSVTLTIQGKDTASGKYYTLLAGAAVVTNVTNAYTVYPAAPATANVSANSPLPRTWRVITTANNANATTYTVGAAVIL